MNEYYTIIRTCYGLPESCSIDLGKEENTFLFETEKQAYKCLELCFNNGSWVNDEQYGKVRYYVEKRQYNYTWIVA